MKVTFAPAALAEVRAATEWLSLRAGLRVANDFDIELGAAISLLEHRPALGSPSIAGTRRLGLRRFPYTIFYRAEARAVRILAVAHQSRWPGYWVGRH